MDEVMIPRLRSLHSMRLAGELSEIFCKAASLSSTLWRMGRPQTGMGTKRGGFLTNPTFFSERRRSLRSTRLREWLTLVVVRKMTGVLNCSDICMARIRKSLASWLSEGSNMGTLANRA